MNFRVGPVAILCVFLSACAASPQQPPAIGAAPLAAAAQDQSVSYDPRVAAAQKRAREMGYHSEIRHGEQFFCRATAPIGSRLTQNECLNVDTMAEAARMADENKAAARQSGMCQGAGCVTH